MGSAATATVTVQALAAGSISGDQSVCASSATPPTSITSSADATGGSGSYTYKWESSTNGGSTWSDVSGAAGASLTFNQSLAATTSYRRGVKDNSNSGSSFIYTDPVVKTLVALPSVAITASPTGNLPPGASVQLTASGANSYVWSTSATTAQITITATSGVSTTVTGTGANGCTQQATYTPTVVALVPGAPSLTGTSSVCKGSSISGATLSVTPTGGSGSGYSYQWQYNDGTGYQNVASSGTSASYTPTQAIGAGQNTAKFRCVVTDKGVSVNSGEYDFTLNSLPVVTLTPSSASVVSGGSVSF
ncbi:MAG: hypothetical protein ACO22D_02760, partial [Schleiferiaceae bacterium]